MAKEIQKNVAEIAAQIWKSPKKMEKIDQDLIPDILQKIGENLHYTGELSGDKLSHNNKRKHLIKCLVVFKGYSPYLSLLTLYKAAKKENLRLLILKELEELSFRSFFKTNENNLTIRAKAPVEIIKNDGQLISEVIGQSTDLWDKKILQRLQALLRNNAFDDRYDAIMPNVYESLSGEEIAKKGGYFLEIWKFCLRNTNGYNPNVAWQQLLLITSEMLAKDAKKYESCFLAVAKKLESVEASEIEGLSKSLKEKIKNLCPVN